MGKNIRKKSLFALIALILLSSCDNFNYSDFESKCIVNDTYIKEIVFNYSLEYELNVPGMEVSYYTLWTGTDFENFYGPNFSEESRLYTYLTEYSEEDSLYYLLYLKEIDMLNFNDWFDKYSQTKQRDTLNYHFVNDLNVIDGKFLLFAQKNNICDYFVYKTNDLTNVPYSFNGKTMAICLQCKNLKILNNVSVKTQINKDVRLLRRYEIVWDKDFKKIKRYYFSNAEENNVVYVDNIFRFKGKRIETYNITFENYDFCYCPVMGFYNNILYKSKRAEFIGDNIILPRYAKRGELQLDLLKEENFSDYLVVDIYKDLKKAFFEAYISEYNYSDNQYIYALYDGQKVLNIIK